MSSLPHHYLTPQEYLAIERAADHKSQYYRGEMFAMAGGTEPHNVIINNISGMLYMHFRGKPCRVYTQDLRVLVPTTGLYTYPDVIALCGKPEFEDGHRDTLLNPNAIVEVLSPSTAEWDRGGKFDQYMSIVSLREYVLISQDQVRVVHYARQDSARQWLLTVLDDPDAVLRLESVGAELPLADIYDKVEFEATAS